MNNKPRIYGVPFARIYPSYIQKVERKGYTQAELDEIIYWMTGYDKKSFKKACDDQISLEDFYVHAPKLHPNRKLITGVICGMRVEEIEEPVMQEIRYMDKLVDELAKGKAMEKILRA